MALAALFLMVVVRAQDAPSAAARLAAAKLAEARGDLTTAETELLQALAGASAVDRVAIRQQLAGLLQKQGKSVDGDASAAASSQQPVAVGDPVQRLIADLERGSHKVPAVDDAVGQLQSLGSLAVPPLLAALPNLGAFGLSNALRVLDSQQDARIAAALLQRLDGADPAETLAIAERLASMHATTALPVARALGQRDVPPMVLLAAFTALRRHGVDGEETRTLAVRMAMTPATHAALQDLLDDARDDVATAVHAEIMASGSGYRRAQSVVRWLRQQKELTEAAALDHIGKLEPAFQGWVAGDVAERHPDWVRAGVLALRRSEEAGNQVNAAWFQAMEWWRLPDEAAAALLALPERMPQQQRQSVARALVTLVERGWMVPAKLQPSFTSLLLSMHGTRDIQRACVRAMPVADEERALGVWQGLDAVTRRVFTDIVVDLDRPWHRLVARQLAACEHGGEVSEKLVARDWTGAPADAVATLVATVERWPLSPEGKPLLWHDDVVDAYRRCKNLPAAVVLPLVPHVRAWFALAEREPQQALALARTRSDVYAEDPAAVARLLDQHGSADDVPLGVRLVPRALGSHMPGLEAFLIRCGSGRLEVIALGGGGMRGVDDLRKRVALAAAHGARIEQLNELLELMGELTFEVVDPIFKSLVQQVRAEHGPAIAAALLMPRSKGTEANRLIRLARLAARSTNPVCLPPLRQLLAKGTANGPVGDNVAQAMAQAMLELAGAVRRPMLEELLASSHAEVVSVALVAPELRADAELRAVAKAAILRLVDSLEVDQEMFAVLPPDDAAALAKELLLHERFAAMPSSSCVQTLEAPRLAKRTIEPALLARAASHQDPDVRIQAATELGNTFTREAAPFLIEMLKDAHHGVRETAQRSLDQIANYLDAKAKWEQRLK